MIVDIKTPSPLGEGRGEGNFSLDKILQV